MALSATQIGLPDYCAKAMGAHLVPIHAFAGHSGPSLNTGASGLPTPASHYTRTYTLTQMLQHAPRYRWTHAVWG